MSLYAQLSLNFDRVNKLETKSINFKGNYLHITPYIDYSSENKDQFTVELELKIYNKNKEQIENDNELVFVITDWGKFKQEFKNDEKGFVVVRDTKFDGIIVEREGIFVLQDKVKIAIEKFKSGYSGFKERSSPITIKIEYIPRSIITLHFDFTHITQQSEKKKKINGQPFELKWEFQLPDSKSIAAIDCKQLFARYKKELEEKVDGKSLTDFKRQLKFQNIDIKKLKSEFEAYKLALQKIADLKKAVEYNKNFDQCTNQKKELLLIFDTHLKQKKEFTNVEMEIQQYESNICKNYQDKYSSRLNKIKLERDLDYFISSISDSKTSVFQLEDEIQEFKSEVRVIKKIKNDILSNPISKKCKKEMNQLLSRIEKIKVNENELLVIDRRIQEEKEILAQNKDRMLDELYNNNSRVLADFQEYFNFYKIELTFIESELENQINSNILRVTDLYEIWSATSGLSDTVVTDTLKQAKELLELCSQINIKNQDMIDSLELNIIRMTDDIEKKMLDCNKEFIRADNDQGLQRAEPLLLGFRELLDDISINKEKLDEFRNKIINNNLNIAELNSNFNPSGQLDNKRVLKKYKSLFVANLFKLSQLEQEFNNLRKEFDENQFKKSYFKWVKQGYIMESEDLERNLNSFRAQHDSLKIAKGIDFNEYGINDYIEEISNFEQRETSLKKRLGYLFNDLEKSIHRKFPYVYVLLGIIILAILAFGAKVYVNALRIRKREQIRKETQSSSTVNKIIIKKSFENTKEKGKGITDVRKKVGTEYLEIDMNYEWDDSAVCKVYYKRDCIIKTYRFFEDSLKTAEANTTAYETGGYLIGRWDYNPIEKKKFDITLEEFIEPGDDAKFSNYQLNFGAKIGVRLQKVLANITEKTGKEYVMTAWFHSHPGLKIFLSDFDLNVQDGFSYNKETLKMLAIVLDPYTKKWDTGFFTYKLDGSGMNNSKDSKRFFSLDTMYNWALNPQDEKTDDYFSLNLNEFYKDTICERIYFKDSFILEVKRLIEEKKKYSPVYIQSKSFLKSYCKNDVLLEKMVHAKEFDSNNKKFENEIYGLLIQTDKELNHPNIFSKTIDIKSEQLQIILIYNTITKQLFIVSRNSKLKLNKPVEKAIIPFKDMIEWTRKRK